MERMNRNDQCWCGSGKKYKKCHMESDIAGGAPSPSTIKPAPGVIIKTPEQIEGIRKSCIITRDVLAVVADMIEPGITTETINRIVHEETLKRDAIPAPLNYLGFPKSVCTSVNQVICHGIPDGYILRDGDIINVDVTSIYRGYYGDASLMFTIGDVSDDAKRLVRVAKECLDKGIECVKPYIDISIIGSVIDAHATANGVSVVRDYGGHGIGVKFHEEPHIHHYRTGNRGIPLLPGMTFTIEPMINQGNHKTRLLGDDWTVITTDGKLSAQWEHTILVTETGCEILTE